MTAPKGIQALTLAEKRAEASGIDIAMKRHAAFCAGCRGRNRCDKWKAMGADLRKVRDEIAHWFDPSPDMETLF